MLITSFAQCVLTLFYLFYCLVLQDDLKTHLYIEKKAFYAKISTVGKNFPMKVKVTGEEGVYDFFFSFFDPFPNKDKASEEFP